MTKPELLEKIKRLESIVSYQNKMNNERVLKIEALEFVVDTSNKSLIAAENAIVFKEIENDNEKTENAKLRAVISEMAREIYLPEGLK